MNGKEHPDVARLVAGGPAIRRHLETCDDCRAQLKLHAELEATFAGLVLPTPPAGFAARLERRRARREARRREAWRRAVMTVYWMLAGAATLGIAAHLTRLLGGSPAMTVSLLLAAAVPLTLGTTARPGTSWRRLARWLAPLLQ